MYCSPLLILACSYFLPVSKLDCDDGGSEVVVPFRVAPWLERLKALIDSKVYCVQFGRSRLILKGESMSQGSLSRYGIL